jgi:segregation and condensation protein B
LADLTKNIEAILFSVGDKISINEISILTKEKDHEVIKKCLLELKEKFDKNEGPLFLHQEGDLWKLNVREEHLSTVRKVVKKMELPKTLLETLAVIAWRAPVKQSKVIAVRTNKAYDHLDELEKMGYISRKKYGRTKLISLTEKFNDYFEINTKGGLDKIFKKITQKAKQKYGRILEEMDNAEDELDEEGTEGETSDIKSQEKINDNKVEDKKENDDTELTLEIPHKKKKNEDDVQAILKITEKNDSNQNPQNTQQNPNPQEETKEQIINNNEQKPEDKKDVPS